MKFLFREESCHPDYWPYKKQIVNAYFENCEKLYIEPWFKKDEPITKANWDMVVWQMKEWGAL